MIIIIVFYAVLNNDAKAFLLLSLPKGREREREGGGRENE